MKNSKEGNKRRYNKWYQNNKEAYRPRKATLMRKYRAENPEKYRKQSRDAKARLKAKLFEMYGYECAICGFEDTRALTLDHIKGNGNKERARLGERGVYRRAVERHRPTEYRTLCMNCQFIERSKSGVNSMAYTK